MLHFRCFSRENLFKELVQDQPPLAPALDDGLFGFGLLFIHGFNAREDGELRN